MLTIADYSMWVIKVIQSCETDTQLNGAQRLLPLFGRMFNGKIHETIVDLCRTDQMLAVKTQRQIINSNNFFSDDSL